MDLKVIISLGLLAVLGFLFYPSHPGKITPELNGEWVAIKNTLDSEPLHAVKLRKDNPVVKTYDLGYIYRIDRAEVLFDGLPKEYDILTSKDRNAPEYERAISSASASGEHIYPLIRFPPKEARWVQIVVNDWAGTQPEIRSAKIGARYQQCNPIKGIRTRYNQEETYKLVDGLKLDSSPSWIGAKRAVKVVKEGDKTIKETNYEPPDRGIDVTFDLGSIKRIYGIAVTTGGSENNLKKYEVSISIDDRNFQSVYSSPELENKFLTDSHTFANPYQARYVRLSIGHSSWYGKYPEIKEVEIYTDEYRLSDYNEPIEAHNAIQVYYDDCGGGGRSPNLIQGFPFDRGEEFPPETRYFFKSGEEVSESNSPAERSFCYHYDRVSYLYSNLDPSALYWVQVTYLQEKNGERVQSLDVDGFVLHESMQIPTDTAKKYIFAIPPDAYADGKMELHFNRIAGPNAVVSEVMVFQAARMGAIPIVYEGDKTGTELSARAPLATAPVVIDGTLDEWPQVFPIVPQQYKDDPTRAPCQMYVQWDANNLFIGFTATGTSSGILHLFLDTTSTKSKSSYKPCDHHFRFYPLGKSGKTIVSQVHHYQDAITKTIEDHPRLEIATKTGETKMFVLEARIPKDLVLHEFSPQIGGKIGFNYLWGGPSLVKDGKEVVPEGLFWSAASIFAPPVYWGELEFVESISGQVAIMDQNLTGKLSSFNAGDTIVLSVLDPDRNTDKNSPQTIKVRISGNLTGDTKEVTLYEVEKGEVTPGQLRISNDSSLFAAQVNTQFGTTPSEDPLTLTVQGKELVTLEYIDPYYAPSSFDYKVICTAVAKVGTNGVLTILSRTGKEISRFPAGLRLFFKVEDEDMIKEGVPPSGETQKISIVVSSENDTEMVTLVDEKNSGIFIGSLETAYSETRIPNDGILQVVGGEKISAVYKDPIQASGDTNVPVSTDAIVDVGNDGSIAIGKLETESLEDFTEVKSFNAGDSLVVIVQDIDEDKDSAQVEQVNVKVEGDMVGDSVTLTLTETAPNSASFIGVLRTAYGLKPDKTDDLLEVKGGETIKAVFKDVIRATGATMVEVSKTAVANVGSDGTISVMRANYLWDLDNFNAGDTLYFKVEDADLNTDPKIRDQIEISVVSEKTQDGETVTLQERDPDSGVFFGLLSTVYSRQPSADSILQVQGDEKVTAIYLDRLRSSGEINVPVIDSCSVNIGTRGSLSIYTRANPYIPVAGSTDHIRKASFKAGEILVIRLQDFDINANSTNVVVSTEGASRDSVTVVLTRVVGGDGIFAGELRTEFKEEVVPGDDILQVRGGDQVSILYLDAITDTGETQVPVVADLTVRTGESASLSTKLPPPSSIQEGAEGKESYRGPLESITSFNAGASFIVEVHDSDLNVNPDAFDYATVTIKGNLLGDELQLVLQENLPNSGTFSGVVQSARALNADPDDVTLQVSEREVVTVTYIDEIGADGIPDIPVSIELVVRTESAGSLLVVDENLREISSFSAGQTLYFRLDDLLLSSLSHTTARITIKGNVTKDAEEVLLKEIPSAGKGQKGRGIYIGSIPTNYGGKPAQDGVLQVQGGEEVRITYDPKLVDPLTRKPVEQIIRDIRVNKGTTGRIAITEATGLKIANFNIGDKLYFKLEDPDINFDSEKSDTVDIWVSGEAVTNRRRVTLSETSKDSGMFTGHLQTRLRKGLTPSPSDEDQAVLEVMGGERVSAVYYDALTESGETSVEISEEARANMIGFATYALESVTIDGDMAGWPLENALPAGDEGSNVYIQWDKDNLYILAIVSDTSVVVPDPTRFWDGADALEFFIDTKPSHGKMAEYEPADPGVKGKAPIFVLWFCPKGGGADKDKPFAGVSSPQLVWNHKDIETSVSVFPGSGYVLEARIPFNPVLGGFSPYETPEDDIIGFNYVIHRSDAGQQEWAEVIEGETSEQSPEKPLLPSNFGTLVFKQPK